MPVEITVFEDRSFDFIVKSPPASDLLRKAAEFRKEGEPTCREGRNDLCGQVKEIAETKIMT
ncbi:MAG: hypothetical protein CM1200mP3_04320 [Chloroflexota bacterium]|nr:MAG: hypothetical protein CM1200mP3_04320 [Chloroflexota bacterium]